MNPLEFLETLTVEQFKARMLVEKIKVKPSKTPGKYFFVAGTLTGAVASKGIPTHPMLSHVKGEPTERNPSGEFWMLHEEAEGAPTIAEF